MTDKKPRWIYRFDNYKRAFGLLREAIETLEARELTQLEKEGIIQRFEYTWDLAWKVMQNYLDYQGVMVEPITPRATIREAFAANLIEKGDVWMKALDARNRMSHTYSFKTFETVIESINSEYLALFDQLHMTLIDKAMAHE